MNTSVSLYAYEDCYELLDRALEASEGIRALCKDGGDANQLRLRLHRARILSRSQSMAMYPDPNHPEHGKSVYDDLIVSMRAEGRKWWIYISRRKVPLVIEELPSEDDDARTQATTE